MFTFIYLAKGNDDDNEIKYNYLYFVVLFLWRRIGSMTNGFTV